MVRLEVIEIEQPSEYALESLMAYASVSDEGQKDILKECLVRAFDMVQRASDTALLSGKWRISADDHSGTLRVYMNGKVESVTDGTSPVMYNQKGRNVYVGTDEYCEVVFTTEVNEAEYVRLLPVVLRYATALYDGKEGRELNAILREC